MADDSLDTEQLAALNETGHVLIAACPGSGKSTAVVSKIIHELERLKDGPRSVLCLTYTRAAVRSIQDKLRSRMGNANLPGCVISTIHGFLYRQVFIQHFALLGFDKPLKLLAPESTEYVNFVNAIFTANLSALEILPNVRRELSGAPSASDLDPDSVMAFWALLEEAGYTDFSSILYYATKLLIETPWIAHSLSAKYATIIVDEFQDTSVTAIAAIETIRDAGMSTFILVGDPRQLIYSFTGVTANSLALFVKSLTPNKRPLDGSYRCGNAICRDGSGLQPQSPPFHSRKKVGEDRSVSQLVVAATPFDGIMDTFLPRLEQLGIPLRSAAILSSSKKPLRIVAQSLDAIGISVSGPAARLYSDTNVARFAEAIAAYSRHRCPGNVRLFEDRFLQLFTNEDDDDRLSESLEEVAACVNGCIAYLYMNPDADILFLLDEILSRVLFFGRDIDHSAVVGIEVGWEELRKEFTELNIASVALAEQVEKYESLTLSTIHGAKGLEYRAVGLIGFNEGTLPDFRSSTTAEISEDRRKAFVAVTRAMDYILYISDRTYYKNEVSSFARFVDTTWI